MFILMTIVVKNDEYFFVVKNHNNNNNNNNNYNNNRGKKLQRQKQQRFRHRFYIDENRDTLVRDMPFTPHTILNTYDYVDANKVVTIIDNDLNNVQATINLKYDEDYCSKNIHRPECITHRNMWKCFGKVEFSKKECEAPTDLVGNRVTPGVWDTSCFQNIDCPFYKANQNYPNEFGKCLNGYCEMPKGIERIGYKGYNKHTLPLCYNCNANDGYGNNHNIGPCCSSQRQPDYMFEQDLPLRYKYKTQLAQSGLDTITHDNHTKEFQAFKKIFSKK